MTVHSTQYELFKYDPVANPKAVLISGNARFTVLTPKLIRMEYSRGNQQFEDRATLAFVNRNLTVPSFTFSMGNGILSIQTSALTLSYTIGTQFSANTLKITGAGFSDWNYGLTSGTDPLNLLGTIRSLDEVNEETLNCTLSAGKKVHDETLHCEWGLISRSGWSLVDDSTNWGLDSKDWWESQNTDIVDLYFFGYGNKYKEALYDFTKVAGKIAMVPRYSTGIMWSRWYNLNGHDMEQIVNDYSSRDIPLDVFILDMDWHSKQGWGGYTFDPSLFPIPVAPLSILKDKGLHFAVNLHDDDGVRTSEKMYNKMAQALGYNPATHGTIKFNISKYPDYIYALEDIVLKDVSQQGINFWWTDWQQGGTEGGCAGGKQNPTIMLNKVRGTDNIRTQGASSSTERNMILNRWGGLGNHRYQIGFSGDVAQLSWGDLAYQPFFSYTASNVGFGFWSHDLLGPSDDNELHTRWIQWGAFSGTFRTHDRGMASGGCANNDPSTCAIVEVWNMPQKYFDANREAMRHRVRLVPYIYTAHRQAFDNGVSLLRPMYYEYPDSDEAYYGNYDGTYSQYMFGDDIIVAPVVQKAGDNGLATSNVWIPDGGWFDYLTGEIFYQKTNISRGYLLSQIPMFIKYGAIIPTVPIKSGDTLGIAHRQYTTLEFSIYPGKTSGTTKVYEDDGKTLAYTNNIFGFTNVAYTRSPTTTIVTISANGYYPERPTARNFIIRLANSMPVTSATVNGLPVVYNRVGGINTWRYDGDRLEVIVETDLLLVNKISEIVINTISTDAGEMSGMKGKLARCQLAKNELDPSWFTPGSKTTTGGKLSFCASTGQALSYLAPDSTQFTTVFEDLDTRYANAKEEIASIQPPTTDANYKRWNIANAIFSQFPI